MANERTFNAMFSDAISYINSFSFNYDNATNKRLTHFLIKTINGSRNDIETRYTRINKEVKESYMEQGEPIIRLDRHKCAAVFMVAFLERLNIDSDTLEKIRKSSVKPISKLFQEKIAIEIGMAILVTMILGDPKPENDLIIQYLDLNDNAFRFPNVVNDNKQYEKNWAMELHYARKKRKLFALSLSNELFCVEKHNRWLAGEKE